MKAIVYYRYGPQEVLQCEEIETPTAHPDQVLIRVCAASVNPLDWHFMRGTPYFLRLLAGLRKPRDRRFGVDVAGQVVAVGSSVTQFRPGDEVFGGCRGAFAEYAIASEEKLVKKPSNVTFEQAATVSIAGCTALQGLRSGGPIQSMQKVLINGAAGGVGTFAVQIAKSFGAVVTGVCSTKNNEMVRSIGADQVIDYTKDNFSRMGHRYHLILDTVGNHSLFACRRALLQGGTYAGVGGSSGRWMIGGLLQMLIAPAWSRIISQNMRILLARPGKEDLLTLKDLMATGKVRPVIERQYKLQEVPEAIRYLEQGHARGKIVIKID